MTIEITRRVAIHLLIFVLLFIATIARMAWSEGDARGYIRGCADGYVEGFCRKERP